MSNKAQYTLKGRRHLTLISQLTAAITRRKFVYALKCQPMNQM